MAKKISCTGVIISWLAIACVLQVQACVGMPMQGHDERHSSERGYETLAEEGLSAGGGSVGAFGLTGDLCKLGDGMRAPCQGARECGRMKRGYFSRCDDEEGPYCYCIPDPITVLSCQTSRECVEGERCVVHMLANNLPMCVSCASWYFYPFFTPVDDGDVSCNPHRHPNDSPHNVWDGNAANLYR